MSAFSSIEYMSGRRAGVSPSHSEKRPGRRQGRSCEREGEFGQDPVRQECGAPNWTSKRSLLLRACPVRDKGDQSFR